MPIISLNTEKSVYYIGEIFTCGATMHCDTVGGMVDSLTTLISTDLVKWEVIERMQGVTPCGITCILGCTYEISEVAQLAVGTPGTIYVGCAIESSFYPSITEQFAANPASVKTITILDTLPDGTGAVKITSSPGGADVYLDGALWGEQTTTTVVAPVGAHDIRLVLPGYASFSVSKNFLDGVTGEYYHQFSSCDLLCQITQTIEDNALVIGVGAAVTIGAILLLSMTTPGQRSRMVKDTTKFAKGAYNTGKKAIRERYKEDGDL
jgi:hypothetical protein